MEDKNFRLLLMKINQGSSNQEEERHALYLLSKLIVSFKFYLKKLKVYQLKKSIEEAIK